MNDFGLAKSDLSKLEITTGLERALDQNFQRLFETAKAVWERRFAGSEASDACVSVRIAATDSTPEAQSTPSVDCAKLSQTSASPGKAAFALHFAH